MTAQQNILSCFTYLSVCRSSTSCCYVFISLTHFLATAFTHLTKQSFYTFIPPPPQLTDTQYFVLYHWHKRYWEVQYQGPKMDFYYSHCFSWGKTTLIDISHSMVISIDRDKKLNHPPWTTKVVKWNVFMKNDRPHAMDNLIISKIMLSL